MHATTAVSRLPLDSAEPLRFPTMQPLPLPGDEPTGGGVRKPLSAIGHHLPTILFCGGLLGGILAYAASQLVTSKYTANSLIRVYSDAPHVYSAENPQGRNDFASYVKTQAGILRSDFVLNAALRDPAVSGADMLRRQSDPVRYLAEEIAVEFQDGSELIRLKLAGDDPTAIASILNAVQESFFREVVGEEKLRKKRRLQELEEMIERMKGDTRARRDQIKQAEGPLDPSDPIRGITAPLAATQVVQLRNQLLALESDAAGIEREKIGIRKRLENPDDELIPPSAALLAQLDSEPKIQALAKTIEQAHKSIDYLTRFTGTPDSPAVQAQRTKIAEAEAERERLRNERVSDDRKNQRPLIERQLKDTLERADGSLANIAARKERLAKEIDAYETLAAQGTGTGELPPDFTKVDLHKREKIITDAMDRAALLRLEVNAPPRVVDFQRAAVPLKKETKKQILAIAAAGLFGIAIVALGFVGYESRVQRVFSLKEVRAELLGPILGALPAPPRPGVLDAATDLAQRDAADRLRMRLMQQFDRPGPRVIMLTSATGDEGKLRFALLLARAFAEGGSPTALVDVDFRSPVVHGVLGVPNDYGFARVLAERLPVCDAMIEMPEGYAVLTAGTDSPMVRRSFEPTRLHEVFEELRARFGIIIIHAPPTMAAELSLLSAQTDAAVLCVRKLDSRMPACLRAHETLAGLNPPIFGIAFAGASADEIQTA